MAQDTNRLFYGHAYFVSILALFILISLACKAMQRQNTHQVQTSNRKASEITEITLSRSVCFGDCPAYKVTFRYNGPATYVGEAHSPLIGTYEADSSSCPECYFAQLVRLVETQGFFDLQEVYHGDIVDTSSVTVTVVYGGKTKTVVSKDPDSPIELWGIANAIDGVVSKLKWKKVS